CGIYVREFIRVITRPAGRAHRSGRRLTGCDRRDKIRRLRPERSVPCTPRMEVATVMVTPPPMIATQREARYRIGVDIGGTFTDFVLLDAVSGRVRIHKCLTTPKDPSIGALVGLDELLRAAGLTLSQIGQLVHGTTLVTNAIIERTGARLALLA